MTIAEAALATGLTAYTLRYYEQIGLIDPVPRRSGQRVYGEAEMRLIGFVVRLRGTGMSMRDIQAYMRLRRLGETPESIRARGDLLARHAAYLRERLTELTETIERIDEKIALYRSLHPVELQTPSSALPPPTGETPSQRRKHA